MQTVFRLSLVRQKEQFQCTIQYKIYMLYSFLIIFRQIVILVRHLIKNKLILSSLMVLTQDQIKFIVGIIISVPLSFYLRKIATSSQRYLYSFILGTALQLFVYGADIWMPFLVHLIVYGIIKIKGRRCGGFVTGISIVALSIYHIHRLIVDYGSWTLDISTILMSMVCKYSLFAYSYEDGGKDKEKLSVQQQKFKLVELPSLYKYLVYCQFLPTCIIGTAIQFKDFEDYMELKSPFDNIPVGEIWRKVRRQFLYSLACGVFYVMHIVCFPLYKMQEYSFASESPLYIMYFSFFCVALLRFKYYFGWKLSQCAVHASGISYSGENQFDRVKTCDPWIVETTIHLRQKVSHWNMGSELWLRRCIYERAPFKNKQTSQAYVFAISAFWHGFYGGYYLSFFFWFLQINLATKVFKFTQQNATHPFITLYKSMGKVGAILLWIVVNFLFTHNGLYFQILDSTLGFQVLKQLLFLPPLFIVGCIFYLGKLTKKDRKPKAETKNPQQPTLIKQE